MRARPACCEMLRITLRVCGGSLSIQSCKMAERGGGEGERETRGHYIEEHIEKKLVSINVQLVQYYRPQEWPFFLSNAFFFFSFFSIMSSCFIEYRSARQEPEIAS